MNNVIDISEAGLWETMVSYHQSVQFWQQNRNPIYEKAATKEIERYKFLKASVLANKGN